MQENDAIRLKHILDAANEALYQHTMINIGLSTQENLPCPP